MVVKLKMFAVQLHALMQLVPISLADKATHSLLLAMCSPLFEAAR